MSSDESFATRWSRLKRTTAKAEPAKSKSGDVPGPSKPEGKSEGADVLQPSPPSVTAQKPPFDPATLPPIDSIVAGTDIRDFLQSGVPAELAKAALRKAWLADPAIRNFIEMAENQWDFTDPGSIPGFGPMRADDDIADLVKQAMGRLPQPVEPAPSSADIPPPSTPPGAPVSVTAQGSGITKRSGDETKLQGSIKEGTNVEIAAAQHVDSSITNEVPNRRGHGRALPK
jgi:hypothetical protein